MEAIFLQLYGDNDYQSIITPESILFFDMDGTLIETDKLNNHAYCQAFKNVKGYDMPINSYPDRITRQTLQALPELTKTEIEEIIAEKGRVYSENLYLASPISYTVKILETYSISNNSYLVTRAQIERAIETISFWGLYGRFTEIISSNADNKYKDAINRLGVDPSRIAVFENEEKEIQACLQAGVLSNNIIKIDYGKFYNSTQSKS